MHPTLPTATSLADLIPAVAPDPVTVLALAAGFLALLWIACCALLATGAAISTALVLGLRHLTRTITHRLHRRKTTAEPCAQVLQLDRYRTHRHRHPEPDDDPA